MSVLFSARDPGLRRDDNKLMDGEAARPKCFSQLRDGNFLLFCAYRTLCAENEGGGVAAPTAPRILFDGFVDPDTDINPNPQASKKHQENPDPCF